MNQLELPDELHDPAAVAGCPSWPEKISRAVPGAIAKIHADPKDAGADIESADAIYGTVPPEFFATPSEVTGTVHLIPGKLLEMLLY